MGLIELLSSLMVFVVGCAGLAVLVFTAIGISKVYGDYKESKWQKEYGNKIQEETERNRWENEERLRDRIFLLEEIINEKDIKNGIDKINKIISDVDYDTRYNAWNKNEAKWKFYAVSMLGSSEKAQAEISEDYDKYEEQRIQELRELLNKPTEKDR